MQINSLVTYSAQCVALTDLRKKIVKLILDDSAMAH